MSQYKPINPIQQHVPKFNLENDMNITCKTCHDCPNWCGKTIHKIADCKMCSTIKIEKIQVNYLDTTKYIGGANNSTLDQATYEKLIQRISKIKVLHNTVFNILKFCQKTIWRKELSGEDEANLKQISWFLIIRSSQITHNVSKLTYLSVSIFLYNK